MNRTSNSNRINTDQFLSVVRTENRIGSKQQLQVYQGAGRPCIELSVRERLSDLPKRVPELEEGVRGEDQFRQETHFLSEHEQATGSAHLPVAVDTQELSDFGATVVDEDKTIGESPHRPHGNSLRTKRS